jgi:ParB-like chromosome segregation protein Spo0J
LMTPITVRRSSDSDDSYELTTGRHRLAAAQSLGWDEIDAIEIECSDVDAKLWEIAENLHRSELTKLQHDEQVAMWIKLTDEKAVSTQVAPKPQGGRPVGGVRAASRELGIDRDAANRAIKVASLSDEAKAVAREHGLDNNRTALLEAARKIEPAAQVATIVERATRTPKPLAALENNAERRDKKSPDAATTGKQLDQEEADYCENRAEVTPPASEATRAEETWIESIAAECFAPRTPAKFREALNQITMAETAPEAFWAEAYREMAFWGFAYESAVDLLDSAILKLAAIKTGQPDASPPADSKAYPADAKAKNENYSQ